MNFATRQSTAKKKWNDLRTKKGLIIYVGAASCGRAAGCNAIIESIAEYLKKNKTQAEIIEVGCIGMCCFEPLMYIQEKGNPPICYANLEPKIILLE